jgi:anti-sigma-K factor RskA
MHQPNRHSSQDDKLAEFTDQVLAGKADQTASAADNDLLRLEDTVLRLNRTFPPHSPDSAAVKQMLVRLKARIKREERAVRPSFWRRLIDSQSAPQVVMALAVVAVLVVAVITIPSSSSDGAPLTGTALGGGNVLVAAGLIGILTLIYLFVRRK